MESEGIPIDKEYYLKTIEEIKHQKDDLFRSILRSDYVKGFQDKFGRTPNISEAGASTDDLITLIFDIANAPKDKKTVKGHLALDDDVLESIDLGLAKDISRLRKLHKIQGTYLKGYVDSAINDKLFPNFNLHLIPTYRSSSDSPNFQNVPSRDAESRNLVRKGIIPPPGFKIATTDYGSHEVRIIACYFKDPVLIHEVENNIDPHGMWAKELGLDKQKPWKEARFDGKNSFVFPEFYGSYYKSVLADLATRGYAVLESTVKHAENKFWGKYKQTKEGQEELLSKYKKDGYATMLFGHKRRELMSKNQLINSVIQGSAFHCLLWSLNKIRGKIKELGFKSRIPGQIHDELFHFIWPEEEVDYVKMVTKIMTEDIKEENPFLIVPLLAEWSFCNVGAPWATKKSVDPDKLDNYLNSL